jgi:hypothetical protein
MDNIEKLIHEMGQNYVALRKECYTECSNLFDTHELTLAEKNCAKNCFRKLSYAYEHFDKIAYEKLERLKSLKSDSFRSENLY